MWKVHQTLGWQQQIIREAQRRGELAQLAWFIQGERRLSKSERRGLTSEQIAAAQCRTASSPGQWVPYIAVGCQPWVSREWADMLAQMFAASNDEWKFSPALCLTSELDQIRQRYEFGDTWDCICSVCGAVFQACWVDFDICEECSK